MPNTLTDSYQLVKSSTLEVNFIQRLLNTVTVSSKDGFSLELFRNGSFVRSIRTSTDTTAARQGDTLLTVNLGIITVPITDKVRTADAGDYFITYDATVRLMVRDAHQFALGYVQGIDPLQKTVDVILAALKRYLAQIQHDAVSEEGLNTVVKKNTGTVQSFETPSGNIEPITLVEAFGVAILDAQTMSPRPDPKRVAEIEEAKRVAKTRERLRRDEEIKLAEIQQRENIRVEQHQLEMHEQDDKHELDLNQWEHDRFKLEQNKRRDAALDWDIEAKRRQFVDDQALLQQLRTQGYSTADIVKEHPELRYLLERRNIMTGKLENEAELEKLDAPVAEPGHSNATERMHGITREPREPRDDDIYTIAHLGIKVSRHKLSEREAELAQRPAQSLSYLVEELIRQGKQDGDGGLRLQDLIYEIDKKPVVDLADLAPYLDECKRRDGVVTVSYLRGEYSGVEVIVIPDA